MTITIALTKGRIEKKAIEIFDSVGIDVTALRDKGRKLVFKSNNCDVQFILVKAVDVLTYVEHGVADIGIVGKDTILENSNNFYEVCDLKFGKCKFSLCSLPKYKDFKSEQRRVIATKYPKVAKEFFKTKGEDIDIIKIEGSVELAPIMGLAHGIVDIVETGATLRENGLIVLEDIVDISARLIVNKASIKMNKEAVMDIVDKVQKYVDLEEV